MKTLYHFTTVETLLLILNYKTLRFKSLLYVDDPLEPSTSDFGNLGGFKYVSCWTDTPNSIPQWTMYSDNMTITFGKRCSAEDKLKVSKFLEDNKFHIPLFDSSVNIKP